MTTAELIVILQSKDPSGEMKVFIEDPQGLVGIDRIGERKIVALDIFDSITRLKYEDIGEKVLVL